MNFLRKHFDFRCYSVSLISCLVALLIIPCVKYLPVSFGYENGLLENIQMLVLFTGFFMAIKSPINKQFFYFVCLILVMLMLREINCGRTIFFPVPDTVNTYYGWKDIKYGWLAHPIYGTYIAYVAFYFLRNKLFKDLWSFLSKTKLPLWNILLMILGMGLGMYAEKATHNFVFEEISELLFYVSLVGIIYLYAYHKNFRVETT